MDIYDQTYHLRGSDHGVHRATGRICRQQDAADLAAGGDGRFAAGCGLAALNIADELHVLKRKYDSIASDYNERAGHLEGALDEVLQEARRAG